MLNESLHFDVLVASFASIMKDKEKRIEMSELAMKAATIYDKYAELHAATIYDKYAELHAALDENEELDDADFEIAEKTLELRLETELREINSRLRVLQIVEEEEMGYVGVDLRRIEISWVMESNELPNHSFLKMYNGDVLHVKGYYKDVSELVFGIE